MDLTASNVVDVLRERGLVDAGALARGRVLVKDVSRANRNFQVSVGDAGFFVKQVRDVKASAQWMLRREATLYEWALTDDALGRLAPRFIDFDARRHILVTEWARDGESLAQRHQRRAEIPPAFGERLGDAIGRHHARGILTFSGIAFPPGYPRQTPVVLTLGHVGENVWAKFGQLGPHLSALLRRTPQFARAINALQNDWRFDCLMHADMSWENTIVYPKDSPMPEFRIVDWEMADIGDAGWDVGTVLQTFLTAWILSKQSDSGVVPDPVTGSAHEAVSSMRPLSLAFWTAYARARGFDTAKSRAELERGMRFAAIRLVWFAIVRNQLSAHFDTSAIDVIRVGLTLLQDPIQPLNDLLRG